ncbi:nuclear transcription factor Y subunit B-4 isoform X1 [Canna indica]|uniref:Nuclear transcription factor Y subunit B-4 isoform X1 n=1 Tax=Canna indica TaxID=4628 RepID=A0AAQ3KAY8_9LILI|nr:nuclear transcription factor Y subunit B-4 isoform X1 [Canna indica]
MAESGAPGTPESGHSGGGSGAREQDRCLPIANIGRIMRKAVPENGKIAKDAKESVQECVSEFISFVTSEASDKCRREKRKTINGDDLLWAMRMLGFEEETSWFHVPLINDQPGKRDGAINRQPTDSFNGM